MTHGHMNTHGFALAVQDQHPHSTFMSHPMCMHNHACLAAMLTSAHAHSRPSRQGFWSQGLTLCPCRERRSKQTAAARKRRRLNDQAQLAFPGPLSPPAPPGRPVSQEASPLAPNAGLTPRLQQGIAQLAAAHAAGLFPAQEDAVAATCLLQLKQGQLSPASPQQGKGAQQPSTPQQAKQAGSQQTPSKPRQGQGKQQAGSAKQPKDAPQPAWLKPVQAKAARRAQAADDQAAAWVKGGSAGKVGAQHGRTPQPRKRLRDDQGLNPMKKHPKRRRSVPASSQKQSDKVLFLSSAVGSQILAALELLGHKVHNGRALVTQRQQHSSAGDCTDVQHTHQGKMRQSRASAVMQCHHTEYRSCFHVLSPTQTCNHAGHGQTWSIQAANPAHRHWRQYADSWPAGARGKLRCPVDMAPAPLHDAAAQSPSTRSGCCTSA